MSEPIDRATLSAAIIKAKGLMENAIKSAVNPHFKSQYADLNAVRDATLQALLDCDLTLEQRTGWLGADQYVLFTWIEHASGARTQPSTWPIIYDPDKPQVMGSSLTYARRYQWGLVCGIASEIDDDGEKTRSALADPNSSHEAQKRKTLTNAELKQTGIYASLETECRACQSVDELQAWWSGAQDDIKSMPIAGRIGIEEEKGRKKRELVDQQIEATDSKLVADLRKSVAKAKA